jgi:hypothetical protein
LQKRSRDQSFGLTSGEKSRIFFLALQPRLVNGRSLLPTPVKEARLDPCEVKSKFFSSLGATSEVEITTFYVLISVFGLMQYSSV